MLTLSLVAMLLALMFITLMFIGICDSDFRESLEHKVVSALLALVITAIYVPLAFAPEASAWTAVCLGLWILNSIIRLAVLAAH